MYVDPRDDFKAFFGFKPSGEVDGSKWRFGVKCRWDGFWAIGSKSVSLKSTLSTFWVIWVGLGLWVG